MHRAQKVLADTNNFLSRTGVMKDTAAVNRFNHVDLLFENVKFNREQIEDLNEFIRAKHEQTQNRRK